ncbi:MAG TPA: hypothetical protein VGQ66_05930 [Candidatus Limnocylindria bacterium]|jgi:hypothetical protein|nr:hypothetical protein [Candidatus Limnocylindria bacterium]
MTLPQTAYVLALTVGLAGCAQGGSQASAAVAADAFFSALVQGDAEEAWSHLSQKTRQVIYDNDMAEFAQDVGNADWSRFLWHTGTVSDFDISWGVHVEVDAAAVPAFLVDRRIVAGGPGSPTIILLVQIPGDPSDYVIAGQGLDVDLR